MMRGECPSRSSSIHGFDWQGDKKPGTPLHSSVIYEVHVKGFSKLWPDVPEELRGTYAALGSPAAIDYFKKLGVTAVELLPVHAHIDDKVLIDRGLTNYWGYNTIGFFAPHAQYSSSGQMGEQVVRVQIDGAQSSRGRHRSDSRCGLQSYCRRKSSRADALLPRDRQSRLLPVASGQTAVLPGFHRHGQHVQPAASPDAAAGDGQPALLGLGNARGRISL